MLRLKYNGIIQQISKKIDSIDTIYKSEKYIKTPPTVVHFEIDSQTFFLFCTSFWIPQIFVYLILIYFQIYSIGDYFKIYGFACFYIDRIVFKYIPNKWKSAKVAGAAIKNKKLGVSYTPISKCPEVERPSIKDSRKALTYSQLGITNELWMPD